MDKLTQRVIEQLIQEMRKDFVARLTKIISEGAPSENKNPIKYCVRMWNAIHKLIEYYNNQKH